tara:strand:- start:1205 stop:2266 length:1062 start_codon:yes stop_codon:yes gene_type:complete
MSRAEILRHFTQQASWNKALASPLTAALLEKMADDFDSDGVLSALLSDWTGNPVRDALGLRLLGALHYAVLAKRDDALADAFPNRDREDWDIDQIWPEAERFLRSETDWVRSFIKHPPQTNETRRGFMFLTGMLNLAKQFRMPVDMLELGASAGLNQYFDEFRYTTQNWKWGNPTSPVQVSTEWQASLPPLATPLTVLQRKACDQNPLSLSDPETRLRLKSYIWLDQQERLSRFDAAADLAIERNIQVDKADAVEWLASQLKKRRPRVLTVVCHSVFFQYPPRETRRKLTQLIELAGEDACPDSPLAWLRYEPEAIWTETDSAQMLLDFRVWPGNSHTRLARSDGHVRLVTPA